MSFLNFPISAGESAIGPTPPTGTSGQGIPTGRAYAIAQAASKYNIPIDILVGVFGMETNFGADIRTSTTGAVGGFQFEPGTARQWGYPMTNNPTGPQFQQQANAAAAFLASLYKQTGSWDAALKAYSGGGYGLSQVSAKASQAPSWLSDILNATGFTTTALGKPAQVAGQATQDVGAVLSAIWQWITTPAKWLVILKFVGGALLLLWGLKELTGVNTPSVVPV